MPTFTISAVSPEVRDVSLDKGDFRSYKMHLRDEQGQLHQSVEWFRKASSPAPQQGETIEGALEEGKFGQKFKQAPKQGGFGGRGRDPQERAEIRRQHAQTTALRYMELLEGRGELTSASWETLHQFVGQFYEDSGSAKA